MDTVRAENLSLYGYERDTTPVLRELAQQGVVYQNAFSTAPWTLPSHASMFTGHWAHEQSADYGSPLDDTYPTLAEVLQSLGYTTAGFSGNPYYVTQEYGLGRGFIHFEDYDLSLGQIFMSSLIGRSLACYQDVGLGCMLRRYSFYSRIISRKSANEINAEVLTWAMKQSNRPYFIFINYFDAHEPYLPPAPFNTIFDPKRPPFSKLFIGDGRWKGGVKEIQTEENAYDESIRYLDHEIGVLLGQMRTDGYLENTLIIVTSDHGEQFYEHQVMHHGNSLYRQSVQVPLLFIFPDDLSAGKNVQEPVSLRNIPATVMEIIGHSESSPFPGQPLTRYLANPDKRFDPEEEIILNELSGNTFLPSFYPISKGDMKSIEFDGLRYILNGDGSEELYDFDLDPQELNDLAGTPEGQAALPEYRKLLEDIIHSTP